jgi:hypothetical protein
MNLVGKIFIVLIFVMALLWMGFSVAVYATHQNWKDIVENTEATAGKPLGLQPQLDQQKQRNQDLKDQVDKITAQLAAEVAAKRQALTKLETEKAELERQRAQMETRLAELVKSENDAVAAVNATQKAEEALRGEVVKLRDDISKAQKERDDAFNQSVKLTDDLHQARNELAALKTRSDTVAADLAKAMEVLRLFGLEADPTKYTGIPPAGVEGVVLAVGADGMVEISIGGPDDGLMKGHKLEVVHQAGGTSTYVGRIEVIDTAPNKSVCKVLPEFLQRPIQRGDRVKTQLK